MDIYKILLNALDFSSVRLFIQVMMYLISWTRPSNLFLVPTVDTTFI